MRDAQAHPIEFLERAESAIGLIERVRPIGVAREYQRLLAEWRRGQPAIPRLRYKQGPPLGHVQRLLGKLVEHAEELLTNGWWVAERASELLLEAHLATAVASADFVRVASVRFPQPQGDLAVQLESLSGRWLAEAAARNCDEPTFASDDRSSPKSLWSVVSRRLGALRLAVQLRVDPDLMSVAACGDGLLVIRSQTWLTARAAERIAQHEILGHLLTRHAGRQRLDILRCGCAGSTDDEEGRALLIEERLGLMDVWRRGELGARHLACVYLRRGATFVDMVRGLVERGAPLEMALRAVLRAGRGGGMGREIVYLPAMQRLRCAFETTPQLESWFELGRASLKFAKAELARSRAA